MGFNFDEIVDRSAASCTYSSKWERYSGRFAEFDIDEENSLPMWVADMDFKCIPEVTEALHRRAGSYNHLTVPTDHSVVCVGGGASA